tara:strand:- start:507 stop:827 length:321 start_codon:yes stop_codon:yes gene_type:complete
MTKSKAIPTTEKALHYHNKAQLVTWILSYQDQIELSKAQLHCKKEDVKALIKGIDQTNQDFISPRQYMKDITKRSARHSQEVKHLITDTKNAFKTVKRLVSLPSFI